jgi:hypothetical protein
LPVRKKSGGTSEFKNQTSRNLENRFSEISQNQQFPNFHPTRFFIFGNRFGIHFWTVLAIGCLQRISALLEKSADCFRPDIRT